ncbi:hypothetical protein FRB94_007384 [Tulasnella sp. JGI-2019a]|nr:hypothetical protein FRB94_007384 [Tulasnella sp. JGI-2019a]KAG9029118.1 hypothetical protein FRB95_005661 [Tulasnella sp. JGI-2019a]
MAPFSSMLKSKRNRKQRPVTPPSPGSFVSHSPKLGFGELLLQETREQQQQPSAGPSTRSNRQQQQQYDPEYFDVIDIVVSPSQSSNNDYSPSINRQLSTPSPSSGSGAGSQTKPQPLNEISAQYAPSVAGSGFSTAPLSTTLSVLHTPHRDSVMSDIQAGSDSQQQLMAFAFPLPPTATPMTANFMPNSSKSFSVRDRDRPMIPPPSFPKNPKLNKPPSLGELKASASRMTESSTKDMKPPKAKHPSPLTRSRSATLPLLPYDDQVCHAPEKEIPISDDKSLLSSL